jgi:hypothetical protein
MEELNQEFRVARGPENFDMTQEIGVPLPVSQGMAEREAARIKEAGQDTSEVDFQVSTKATVSSGKWSIARAGD